MKFKQYENGSCDIEFSAEEIKIINEKKILHLTDENLKHFGNHLVKIVMDWQIKFDPKIANLTTFFDTEIKGK
jgi:hypothetical protein